MAASYMLICLAALYSCVSRGTATMTYTMDSYCGNTVDMDDSNLDSMKLRLTYSSKYRSNMDCKMRIKTRSGQRLSFKFLDMDIAKIFTCDDYLEIRDGSSSSSSVLGYRMCGETIPSSLSTSGRNAFLRFKSNSYKEDDGFTILVTSFNTDTKCNSDEFSCDNGRCIDQSLYCDSYDNCGDDSDDCYMDTNWWVWMVIGIVVFIIFCAIVITVICCCCCKRASRGTVLKTTTGVNYNAGAQTVTANPWYGNTNNQIMTQPGYLAPPPNQAMAPPSYTAASGDPTGYPQPAAYPQPTTYQPVAYPPQAGAGDWQALPPNAPPPYAQKGENSY
ncbi:abnormal cell migration protein 13-like [Haliotis rubra]|uniref:abnormal cell migration protein 13-like n=1 Tax=Haliotis rubra TaxID=36100 RepID=UPI001EE5B56E|nr:abnormal cell migration protein 13-like [Haliotis rubra]